MRSSNPALQLDLFNKTPRASGDGAMTVQGSTQKTLILAALLTVAGFFSWQLAATNPQQLMLPVMVGGIGGFITALVTIFKKEWAPYTAPLYAVLQGLVMGGVSAMYEGMYNGIVLQAVMLTLATLFAMHTAFSLGWIKVTDKFRMGVFAATGGIAIVYLIAMVLGFFGVQLPFLYDSSPLSIGISFIIVGVAALNLALDFDFIERGAQAAAPKYMEWYAAFGLMVTLIWLYMEILRLLAKMRSRD